MLLDLHLHTTRSDGVWEPERLYDEIRSRRLELFCVSDHDTLDAYPMPADLAPRSIPGLEVDSEHDGHTVHLLAYGVSDKASPLLDALTRQRIAREERMEEMIARLRDLGVHVDLADVREQAKGSISLGRPHLARALVQRGYVKTVQQAFDEYLQDEGSGFVALRRLTSAHIVELTHESGGISVVAHPMRLRRPQHLDELVAAGVDGVEIVHPTAEPQDERRLRGFARERGLLVTGGTDFHAPVEGRPIGIEFDGGDAARLLERLAAVPAERPH